MPSTLRPVAALALALASLLSIATPAHAVPAEDDLATLDLITSTIAALEAGDDAAYADAVDALDVSNAWIPAAGGHMLATRDLDGLTTMWLALEADDTSLLRLASDTISTERDALVFRGDDEAWAIVQSADLGNAIVLQVIDRRGIEVPDVVRTVMTVNPRPGAGEPPPRPALFDDAAREIANLITTPIGGPDGTRTTDESASPLPAADVDRGAPTARVAGLAVLATIGAILLVRRRRRDEQLADLAFTDGLTGLNNRRRLEADVDAAKAAAARPTTVVMIDVDHFKEFNDRHGHRGGDEALRRVAAAISDSLRADDVAYRYGGEEFCAIVRDTPDDVAMQIAERVRRTISATPISLGDGQVHSVTASIGLASGRADSIDDLITSADAAMYSAKHAGRNQLAFA